MRDGVDWGSDGGPLQGKVAVVTGAARGLGRAFALRLAELGADTAVLDADLRSFEQFEEERELLTAASTKAEVEALGRRSVEIQVDVTDSVNVEAAMLRVAAELGGIDILVCNAGGGIGRPAETKASEVSAEIFDAVVQRNLYGTVNSCRAAVPIIKSRGGGRIITVSSQAGRVAPPGGGYAPYGAAKAGIAMYSRYLAQELGSFDITVNCMAPGFIGTGRMNKAFEAAGVDAIRSQIALGRIGTPDDCANVIEFLAGPLGAYVTGALIPVDGGSVR